MTTLYEAAAALRASGSVLRVGDVIQTFPGQDFEMLTGTQVRGWCWPALHMPIGFGPASEMAGEPSFVADIPGDFAERAALDGRIVYPVDGWSTFGGEPGR